MGGLALHIARLEKLDAVAFLLGLEESARQVRFLESDGRPEGGDSRPLGASRLVEIPRDGAVRAAQHHAAFAPAGAPDLEPVDLLAGPKARLVVGDDRVLDAVVDVGAGPAERLDRPKGSLAPDRLDMAGHDLRDRRLRRSGRGEREQEEGGRGPHDLKSRATSSE